MSALIDELVSEADAAEIPDGVLIRYLSGLWADPDLRPVLEENSHFVVERLRSYGQQAYLTPQERQALCKVLFAGSGSVQRRILNVQRRREESVEGLEAPAM
jgi:hypothetical protein